MPDPSRPRLLDTHVHFWDPIRPEWYAHLSPEVTIDYRRGRPYPRRGGHSGRPGRAAAQPLFRGVRVLEGLDYESAKAGELLRMLADRGLIFDLVTHPGEMAQAADALARFPEAAYVVEHTGWPWPDRFDDPGYFALWQKGMSTLNQAGGNVHCKLSGLPMSTHDMDIRRMRPWIEHCLEVFGPGRCVIGSNFPVDRLFGGFGTLMSVYAELTEPLGPEGQQAVFAGNAARIYRIPA